MGDLGDIWGGIKEGIVAGSATATSKVVGSIPDFLGYDKNYTPPGSTPSTETRTPSVEGASEKSNIGFDDLWGGIKDSFVETFLGTPAGKEVEAKAKENIADAAILMGVKSPWILFGGLGLLAYLFLRK